MVILPLSGQGSLEANRIAIKFGAHSRMRQNVFLRSWYFGITAFLVMAFYWGGLIYFPYFFKQAGISDSRIGLLVSIVSLTNLILVVPIGILLDRFSPKFLFIVGGIVGAIFSMLFIFHPLPEWYELYFFIFGVAVSLLSISNTALFLKQMGDVGPGSQSAVYNIGDVLGAGIGSEIGGRLILYFGPESVFWMLLVIAGLLFVSGIGLPGIRGVAFHISEYKDDLKHPVSWILIFIVLVAASHAGFEHAGYILLQTEVIGLKPATVGRLFLYISFAMALWTYIAGRISDRWKKQVLVSGLALILSGIFQAWSGYGKGFLDFLILRILHVIGDSTFALLILVIASLVFSKKRAGGSWAFLTMVRCASIFLSANIAGFINQRYGFSRSFLLSGIVMIIAGLIVIFVLRPRFRKEIKSVDKFSA